MGLVTWDLPRRCEQNWCCPTKLGGHGEGQTEVWRDFAISSLCNADCWFVPWNKIVTVPPAVGLIIGNGRDDGTIKRVVMKMISDNRDNNSLMDSGWQYVGRK